MTPSDDELIAEIRRDRAQRAKEHQELLDALRAGGSARTMTSRTAASKIRAGHQEAEKRSEAREGGAGFMAANRSRNAQEGNDDAA